MLLFLLFDNSFLSKPLIQHLVVSFCMFCSSSYRLFCNLCICFYILYFYLYRWSIALLWAPLSTQCLDYQICKNNKSWGSTDSHFLARVTEMSCTVLLEMAAITLYMNYCQDKPLRLGMMEDPKSLTLRWCSFSQWGREIVGFAFARKCRQYLILGCLQPIAT